MGASKNYRGAAASGAQNTPRGAEKKYSTGSGHNYEGTIMSGGESLRSGAKAGGNKSSSSKGSVKRGGAY